MVRLIRARRSDLSIRRERRGKGFSFTDVEGKPVRDAEIRERIKLLGIPPAWKDVTIAVHPRSHIQCLGLDEAGRLQYIYHPDWQARRAKRKQGQLALLTDALGKVRRQLADDLKAEAGTRTLAVALAVAMIDRTAMRVGRERYLVSNGTRGAGTLYARDVAVAGNEVSMTFPAKSGKLASYTLKDAQLAEALARIKALPGRRLLVFRSDDGKIVPIPTAAINAYLRDVSGVKITAKDFRTLHASALAAEALAKLEPAETERARKKQMSGVTREVADFLRNTPLICRQSYIAPCLFTLFEKGRLSSLWNEGGSAAAGLKLRESRLGFVLAAAG